MNLPKGVDARINGSTVVVKGPKGELKWGLPLELKASVKENNVLVERPSDAKRVMAMHGMARNIIANMITGVSDGYQKLLEITGVGYKAQVQGKRIVVSLGFSHPVEFLLPEGITAEADPKMTKITLKGIDKQLLGQVAADFRALRPPDIYKGKGVRYSGETIKLKAGKAGKKQ
ncbi:MAG: 50S ribosomal protein L6 [Nitrospirae bacterium]|nr:50S ribosomal protein L6 [Nitrospirota bacterium]